jgi:Leucine-rich repeat (LRR) protein/GTPase SAR1 family protein
MQSGGYQANTSYNQVPTQYVGQQAGANQGNLQMASSWSGSPNPGTSQGYSQPQQYQQQGQYYQSPVSMQGNPNNAYSGQTSYSGSPVPQSSPSPTSSGYYGGAQSGMVQQQGNMSGYGYGNLQGGIVGGTIFQGQNSSYQHIQMKQQQQQQVNQGQYQQFGSQTMPQQQGGMVHANSFSGSVQSSGQVQSSHSLGQIPSYGGNTQYSGQSQPQSGYSAPNLHVPNTGAIHASGAQQYASNGSTGHQQPIQQAYAPQQGGYAPQGQNQNFATSQAPQASGWPPGHTAPSSYNDSGAQNMYQAPSNQSMQNQGGMTGNTSQGHNAAPPFGYPPSSSTQASHQNVQVGGAPQKLGLVGKSNSAPFSPPGALPATTQPPLSASADATNVPIPIPKGIGAPAAAKKKIGVFPPAAGPNGAAHPKNPLPIPGQPKLQPLGAAAPKKGHGRESAQIPPSTDSSAITSSLSPIGNLAKTASTSLKRTTADAGTQTGQNGKSSGATPDASSSVSTETSATTSLSSMGGSMASNLKKATSREIPRSGPSPPPTATSAPANNSSSNDITSALQSISSESLKLKDDKYSVYTGSGISDLPSMLWKSKYANLHTISVTDSPKMQSITSKLSALRHLTSLSLRGCQITFISSSIEHLGATLQTLDLSENRIEVLPDFVGTNLTSLVTLTLHKNSLNVLPKSLATLSNLTSLDVSSNYLTTLDMALTGLSNLSSLSLASNNLLSVPGVIEKMKSLRRIDLSHNRLDRALPNGLYMLPKLEGLVVSSNKLGDLPAELCLAKGLVELYWDDNRAKLVHDAVYTLTKLKKLKLSRNEISEISERSSRLQCLDLLDLESNQLDVLPHQLFSLPHMNEKTLLISKNPFASVPPEIRYAGTSQIFRFLSLLSEKAAWRRMKLMFVGNGNIGKTSLKRALASGQWHPTARTNSDGVTSQGSGSSGRGVSKVKGALKKAASTASGVVGGIATNIGGLASNIGNSLGGGGSNSNTSSVENPESRTFDPTEHNIATDGIDIDDWIVDLEDYPDCLPAVSGNANASKRDPSPGGFRPGGSNPGSTAMSDNSSGGSSGGGMEHAIFTCYDFAGQDVYYPTHSMFVTSRSIYLVMFSLKDLEGSRVEYWLQMVQAKAAYSSPVIIVATHEDHRSVDKSNVADTLAAVKKRYSRYAFVKGIVSVSSKTGAGIHNLRKMILTIALAHPTMKEQVPRSYVLLESEIKKRRNVSDSEANPAQQAISAVTQHYQQTVTIEQWHAMAEKCFIKTKEDSFAALRFLADVGVVFHFKAENSDLLPPSEDSISTEKQAQQALENIVVLDPQWIADLLSTVISLKHNYVKDGILESKVLPQLWKSYPVELHSSMLDLLKRFEIVLPMAQAGRFMVPSMLPSNEVTWNSANGTPTATPATGATIAPGDALVVERFWNGANKWYGPMARVVAMKFCPMGFFGRFVARALHLPRMNVISYSMNTFVGEFQNTGERVVVIYNEWTYEVLIWSASLQPLEPKDKAIIYAVTDCIEILHESLYSSNRRSIWVVCPHCMTEGHNLKDPHSPTLFELEDCLIAFTEAIPVLPCFKKVKSKRNASFRLRKASIANLRLRAKTLISQVSIGSSNSSHGSAGAPPSGKNSNPSITLPVGPQAASAGLSGGLTDDDEVEYAFNPQETTGFFRDFSTRKEKLKSLSVFLQLTQLEEEAALAAYSSINGASEEADSSSEEEDSSGSQEASGASASGASAASGISSSSSMADRMKLQRVKRTNVPLSKIAPDISFHSLGDLVVPYEAIKQGQVIARGGFAEIFKSEFAGETVAVKKFLSSENSVGGPGAMQGGMQGGGSGLISDEFSESFRELQHESFLMARLDHPNIVSLKALCVRPICMILEWIPGGTLSDLLWGKRAKPLSWPVRLKYAIDCASGLSYLHALNIMHLDFRSPNLLVYNESPSAGICIKVADFGLSTTSSGSHKGIKAFNPFWSSPEIISKAHYDLSTDIYSLGIVMWELLQNGRPFEEHRPKFKGPEIIMTNAIASQNLRPTIPPNTPNAFAQLIQQCWHPEPAQRPSASDVVRQLESLAFELQQHPTAWPAPLFNPPKDEE